MKVFESQSWLLMTLLGWMPGHYLTIDTPAVTCPAAPGAPPPFSDALTAPTGDALLPSIIAATPRGAAWRTDEVQDAGDDSFQHRFWRAAADPLGDLYVKLWKLALASTACTISASEDPENDALDDWENEFGLPGPCTAAILYSDAHRELLLRQKIASAEIVAHGGQSIAYFVCLAATLGYAVAIKEVTVFHCGEGRCGGTQVGGPNNEVFWEVYVESPTLDWFRCGESQCGRDPLGSAGRYADLECLFNLWRPAHTQPAFHYLFVPPSIDTPPPPDPFPDPLTLLPDDDLEIDLQITANSLPIIA